MNELIKVSQNEKGEQIVSARDLHDFVESKERFSKWWDRTLSYGFAEILDYAPYQKVHPQNKQEMTDYVMKLDMAKEVSMIQRNEKGKQARQYFIEMEKMAKQLQAPKLPTTYKEALLALVEEVEKNEKLETENLMLTQQVKESTPKVTYYDEILKSKGLIAITNIAKDYGLTAQKLNKILHEEKVQYKKGKQWLLYDKHADKGYTKSETHLDANGEARMYTKWTQKGRLFIHGILQSRGIEALSDKED